MQNGELFNYIIQRQKYLAKLLVGYLKINLVRFFIKSWKDLNIYIVLVLRIGI